MRRLIHAVFSEHESRRAVHLVGLLRGHFEVEEQVLLPVLDATMTAEEFKREVGDRMAH